jgi:hypothetical protein
LISVKLDLERISLHLESAPKQGELADSFRARLIAPRQEMMSNDRLMAALDVNAQYFGRRVGERLGLDALAPHFAEAFRAGLIHGTNISDDAADKWRLD